jgi:carbamoyl-phosphate synthase small subunit
MKASRIPARLRLEDGSSYEGWSFGARRPVHGEVVFATGMAGYPQSLTDPSYRGQILTMTYPLIGNYGIPDESLDEFGLMRHFESDRINISGLVVAELCEVPSHHASVATLHDWMAAKGIPGITGIDTRALTMFLRDRGMMRGRIELKGSTEMEDEKAHEQPVPEVSCAEPMTYGEGGWPRIALVDCGVKNSILRCLLARGASVQRLPWNTDLSEIDCDGILLSNGPGDPKACSKTIASVRKAMAGNRPIFGICLGNQILALAAGADTYKLPFGHRGQNQPCVDADTGRCHITSQNHGYAVRAESLPSGWEAWFVNGNDGTIEGIRSKAAAFSAVQFHPEGCPGPRDTEYLFDRFIEQARQASTSSPAPAKAMIAAKRERA